jgi:hypothetical protein
MFYLMTDGGNFNGCSINGISRTKSNLIIYHALTAIFPQVNPGYTTVANFKDMYDVITQSCSDLYIAGSDTCLQVEKAMQAVEIDQQPINQQSGARCLGTVRQTPLCANTAVTPTVPANNCNCANDNCSDTCVFDKYPNVNYNSPIKCQRPSSIVGLPANQDDKNAYCQYGLRTKGDADGNGVVDPTDYFYFVSAFYQGQIPARVIPDFDGDGQLTSSDRNILLTGLANR